MFSTALQQLMALDPGRWDFCRGIERETLRVDAQGRIAQTPHPAGLGSALTHPAITTDYSEALLELITPVCTGPEQALDELVKLHRHTQQHLQQELLWPTSMPAVLPEETQIPIAQYGKSYLGQLKTIYRKGLWHRYGRIMQTIAGVHYNWSLNDEFWSQWHSASASDLSLQDFISQEYFAIIRGFRRHSWLLLYLLGASPAVDSSFLQKRDFGLTQLATDTAFKPFATTLRMSEMGYSNSVQDALYVCFNSLESYANTLTQAIRSPHPSYEKIGIKVEGAYRQLNANILQIENEYYSDIRPKRVIHSGEKPIHALMERGVQYIEVRCLDVDPFSPVGIQEETMHFVDLFMLNCLLQDNQEVGKKECLQLRQNNLKVASQGRDPNLTLMIDGQSVKLRDQGALILEQLMQLAESLDDIRGTQQYRQAVEHQWQKIEDDRLTPSAQLIALIEQKGSFREASLSLAHRHQGAFLQPLNSSDADKMQQIGHQSLSDQLALEAQNSGHFDDFLRLYLNAN